MTFDKVLDAVQKRLEEGEQARRDLATLQGRVELAMKECDRVINAHVAVRGTRSRSGSPSSFVPRKLSWELCRGIKGILLGREP